MPAIMIWIGGILLSLLAAVGIWKAGGHKFVDYGLQRLVEFFVVVGEDAISFFVALLPAAAVDRLNSLSQAFVQLKPYLDWCDWAFNSYAALATVSAGLAVAAAIRAVRWIIYLIPFIG